MVCSSPFMVVVGVLCIILIVIVLLGNIFVIEAVRRHAHIRTISNICIASLAVADLFVGLINIPLYVYAIYHQTEITLTYMRVLNSFDIYFGVTSILHLTYISMERCYAITFPLKRRLLRKGTIVKILVNLWIVAGIPVCLYLTQVVHALAMVTGLFFILPLLVIVISYTILTLSVKISSIKTKQFSTNRIKKEVRIAKTLCIVTVFFIVAWLPFFTFLIVFRYPKYFPIKLTRKVMYYVAYVVKFLHYSNSAANPFIYAFRQPEFTNAFKSLVFGSKFRRGGFQANLSRATSFKEIRGSSRRENSQRENSDCFLNSQRRENSEKESSERRLICQRENSQCSKHNLSNSPNKKCCETFV